MKKAKLILAAGLLAFAGTTTFTSCTPDEMVCEIGMEGSNCDVEVRTKYYNTYRGNVSDNHGGTYTDWALKYSNGGSDVKKLKLEILDGANANQFLFDIELTSNTTYSLVEKTVGGFKYTGSGTINENTASLTLTEVDPAGVEETYIYQFNNFNK